MVSILKSIGVVFVSCGFVLYVGLSDVQAAGNGVLGEGESGPTIMQEDQTGRGPDAKVVKGEVLRVEGDQLFVKGENGKEVRLHIDQAIRMGHKQFLQGELIEARVNEESHVLSINSPDRRNDHTLDPGHVMEPPRK